MEDRKKHFNIGEVKTRTLEFMLRHDSPVKESEITELLKSEYSQFNRATVNRHLRDLEKLKCVTKVTPVQKSRFNYWNITTIKNLENIIREYPDLIDDLQESKLALNIMLNALEDALVSSTSLKMTKEYKEKYEEIKERLLNIRKDLTEKLKISTSFFKLCIRDEYSLYRNLSDLLEISENPTAEAYIGDNFKLFIKSPSCIDLAFKSCIALDIMERKGDIRTDMKKEIEFVKEMKNTVPTDQLAQLKNYYTNTDTAPDLLRGAKLVPVCNSELSKIEMEFEDRGGKFVHYDFFREPPGTA